MYIAIITTPYMTYKSICAVSISENRTGIVRVDIFILVSKPLKPMKATGGKVVTAACTRSLWPVIVATNTLQGYVMLTLLMHSLRVG